MMKPILVSATLTLIATGAFAQDVMGVSAGTIPPTPDCQSTTNQPVLLVRNMIEGANITSIYAKPYSAYNEKTGMFLSTGSFLGGQMNLLKDRVLKGKKPDAFLGGDDDSLSRCGFPINFGAYGFRKDCSADKVENIYQVAVNLERGDKKYTLTLTKNVCDESLLDIVAGVPTDNSDKVVGPGVSGAIPDCEVTKGEPKLLFRNYIQETEISAVRARPISDYNRQSHQFMTTAKGVLVNTKPIPTIKDGSCGYPVNFGKYDFRSDCPSDKMQNLYEMTVTMKRGDANYDLLFTRNVCDETTVDIMPGVPAARK
jgi:hypothetical protein